MRYANLILNVYKRNIPNAKMFILKHSIFSVQYGMHAPMWQPHMEYVL